MQRSPPPHPHGRRDPEPTLSEKLPTSPAGFVLLLSFQEEAPQAHGSSQKTPRIWPSTRPPFSNNGLGATSSRESERRRQGRTGGDDAGLENAGGGGGHSRDVRAPQGRVQRVLEAGSRDQSSRGHPGTQRNEGKLL